LEELENMITTICKTIIFHSIIMSNESKIVHRLRKCI